MTFEKQERDTEGGGWLPQGTNHVTGGWNFQSYPLKTYTPLGREEEAGG